VNFRLGSWACRAREGTNDYLSELAERWVRASMTDPLLGFLHALSRPSASLSGCNLLSAYASLSETPAALPFSTLSLKLKLIHINSQKWKYLLSKIKLTMKICTNPTKRTTNLGKDANLIKLFNTKVSHK